MTDQVAVAQKPKFSRIYAIGMSEDFANVLLIRPYAPAIKISLVEAINALKPVRVDYHDDALWLGEIKLGGVPSPVSEMTKVPKSSIVVGYIHPGDDKAIYQIVSAELQTDDITEGESLATLVDAEVEAASNATPPAPKAGEDDSIDKVLRDKFKAETLAALGRRSSDRWEQAALWTSATGHATRDAAFDAGMSLELALTKIAEYVAPAAPAPVESAVAVVEQPAPEQPRALSTPNLVPNARALTNGRQTDNRWWLSDARWQLDPMRLAETIAKSGMYRTVTSPQQAIVVMFKGIEMGLSPLSAFEHINIIGGKPAIDGQLMLAKLRQNGVTVKFLERTDLVCHLEMTRRDTGESVDVSFSVDEAKRIGLTGKDGWKNYPRAMCTWRAVSEGARLLASDILLFAGIPEYVNEELGADVDADGNIR